MNEQTIALVVAICRMFPDITLGKAERIAEGFTRVELNYAVEVLSGNIAQLHWQIRQAVLKEDNPFRVEMNDESTLDAVRAVVRSARTFLPDYPEEVELRVHQDGRRFYDREGCVIFTSSNTVKDGDIAAAEVARAEFLRFVPRAFGSKTIVVWEV